MKIRPISFNAAKPWLAEHHRHLRRPLTGWLFGIEILDEVYIDGEKLEVRIGVACAGRPAARMLQDGLTVEITRVCTHEPGTSCRAAGFRDDGPAGGGEASRPSRPRKPSEDPSPKRRWVWP